MESLKLDVLGLVFQHVHHQLEVVWIADVFGHHREIVSVQEQLPQQLERLSLGHVVITVQELLIVEKHLVIVLLQELCRQHLVSRQQLLEGGEGIGGDVEGADLDVLEEVVEVVAVEDDLGQGLVPDALLQHSSTVESNLLVFVSSAQCEDDLWRGADVLHCGGPGAYLSPQNIVKDLGCVLLTLKQDYIKQPKL